MPDTVVLALFIAACSLAIGCGTVYILTALYRAFTSHLDEVSDFDRLGDTDLSDSEIAQIQETRQAIADELGEPVEDIAVFLPDARFKRGSMSGTREDR